MAFVGKAMSYRLHQPTEMMMTIQLVSFNCVLKNKLGRVISSTFNQNVLTYAESDQNEPIALVEALSNSRKGEKRKLCLRAEEAYGLYLPELVIVRSLSELSMSAEVKRGERRLIQSLYVHEPGRLLRRQTS